MDSLKKIEFTNQGQERLDVSLASSGHGISRSQAKFLIEDGRVQVDGKLTRKPSSIVSPGCHVEVELPRPKTLDLTPKDLSLNILYEDDDLAVLEKPAGLSVHPSETESN